MVDPFPETRFSSGEFLETQTGNKVSKQCTLYGKGNIRLSGKSIILPGCVVRGDLGTLVVGKYCIFAEGTLLRPATKRLKGMVIGIPLTIGNHVRVGRNSIVEAASIGDHVSIGDNCIVGARCILKDCCRLEDNTVLPPDTVVPSFGSMRGNPGRLAEQELSAGWQEMQTFATEEQYNCFRVRE